VCVCVCVCVCVVRSKQEYNNEYKFTPLICAYVGM